LPVRWGSLTSSKITLLISSSSIHQNYLPMAFSTYGVQNPKA
jgi:hypothetical protein